MLLFKVLGFISLVMLVASQLLFVHNQLRVLVETVPEQLPPSSSCHHHPESPTPREADGCFHVFLDVGANVGVHGRFLLEPDKYPNATFSREIFEREFGANRDNRDICVFAFEPNPVHHETLQNKSDAYQRMGWRYHVKKVGVSDKDGTLEFYRQCSDNAQTNNEYGFGVEKMPQSNCPERKEVVPVIRLAAWLQYHVYERELPKKTYGTFFNETAPKVVMKMDIETAEFHVMPDLITSGSICPVDFFFFEFHARTKLQFHQELLMRDMLNISPNCQVRNVAHDDETYLMDAVPLPTPM